MALRHVGMVPCLGAALALAVAAFSAGGARAQLQDAIAGPAWEHVDDSSVQAKVVGSAQGATANDIPWLKLEVTERRGSGALSGADIVQRLNTSGGVLHGSCEHAGSLRSVAY